jgi:hypothetical protein
VAIFPRVSATSSFQLIEEKRVGFARTGHSYEQIPGHLFRCSILSLLELRECAKISAVSRAWNDQINQRFLDVTKKISFHPRPTYTRLLEGLDLATSLHVCPIPTFLSRKAWTQQYAVPTLEAGIKKIAGIAARFKGEGSFKFEIRMPLNPGAHFRGVVNLNSHHFREKISFDRIYQEVHREVIYVVESPLPAVQSLEQYTEDLAALRAHSGPLAKALLLPEQEVYGRDSGYHLLSATLPPLSAALPVQRLALFFIDLQKKGTLEVIENLVEGGADLPAAIEKALTEEEYAHFRGVQKELKILQLINKKILEKASFAIWEAVERSKRATLPMPDPTSLNLHQINPQQSNGVLPQLGVASLFFSLVILATDHVLESLSSEVRSLREESSPFASIANILAASMGIFLLYNAVGIKTGKIRRGRPFDLDSKSLLIPAVTTLVTTLAEIKFKGSRAK